MRWGCIVVGLVALVAVTGVGPPPPARKLTAAERKKLQAKAEALNAAGMKADQQNKLEEAVKAHSEVLAILKRLHEGDHFNVANRMSILAYLLWDQYKLAEAEPHLRNALAMHKRLHKGDHSDVAQSLHYLGYLLRDQYKLAEAEPYLRDALAMRKRLHKGDYIDVAQSLDILATLLHERGKLAEAEPYLRDALAMRKRLHKGDHHDVAQSLHNMARLLREQGKLSEAETHASDALAMRKRLYKGDHPRLANSLHNMASLLREQGKLSEAETHASDALAMRKRLYKRDHHDVAQSLNILATLLHERGKLAEAEPYLRDALAMRKRLHKGDYIDVAQSLNNLGGLLSDRGKVADAEVYYRDALNMYKRLYKGDHSNVARGLNNLGLLLSKRGKLVEAELHLRDALSMRRRLFKGDHDSVANSLDNLGLLLHSRGKLTDAERYHRSALAMYKRLHTGDHTGVARVWNNLGGILWDLGKLVEAERHLRDALAMSKRLHTGDHTGVARVLYNLGFLLHERGKPADAEPYLRDALAMCHRLAEAFAAQQAEGEALTLFESFPLVRDVFLSLPHARKPDATIYSEVWTSKGALARVYERRHLAAHAAVDPKAAPLLAGLTDARRRRADLLLAPQSKDPVTRKKRDEAIEALAEKITKLDRTLRPLLPSIARSEKLAKAAPANLQKALPVDAAVVDFLAYTLFEYDKKKPGLAGEKRTPSYLAFVLTRVKITRVELGPAKPIDDALALWRKAITSSASVPADIPARVRRLVWDKVRKELPKGTKTVYLSPDLALTALPWAALPGDKPGTILLEDFALAVVPHAPFLLDKLWPQERRTNRPEGVLAVGGVAYADAPAKPAAKTDSPLSPREGPPLKEGQPLSWKPLDYTAPEARGVAALAEARKLKPRSLAGRDAAADRVLAELSKARFAHLATHGFFADREFRSVLQVDPKLFEMRGGERVGAGALSPMVMSGLVFAGANKAETPGRGLLTGEALIDHDLSGLELAVLSACETGLGDVAGGEGVFGLQRAFHVAGTRNVIASLWKVDDAATAALMAVFYEKLWEKNLAPMEALRQAQLAIYRNPGEVPKLAKGLRGKFVVVKGGKEVVEEAPKPGKDGKAHPRLWAAFTLSGPGTAAPAR